ncbi:hypothetical protein AHAS_Ahas12G0157300 [Arachis hypogaea]
MEKTNPVLARIQRRNIIDAKRKKHNTSEQSEQRTQGNLFGRYGSKNKRKMDVYCRNNASASEETNFCVQTPNPNQEQRLIDTTQTTGYSTPSKRSFKRKENIPVSPNNDSISYEQSREAQRSRILKIQDKKKIMHNSNEKGSACSQNVPLTPLKHKDETANSYLHMGDAMYACEHCHALFWYEERTRKHYNSTDPKFCCRGGHVEIPHLQGAPKELYELLYGVTNKSKHFLENIRTYNNMFQFTSMGAKIDRTINKTRGPPTFILCGENCHLMGSLLPTEGNPAKFTQLYVFDTQNEGSEIHLSFISCRAPFLYTK